MENENIITHVQVTFESTEAQLKRLYEHLTAGNTINFRQALDLKISMLNRRIAELRNREIKIYTRDIRIGNIQCKEYSLYPFG